PYLAYASCCVAPMRIARGVQNKVLEAMAMAKPVVLTPAALEGLSAVPGQDLLVASNARDFADRVSDVLSNDGIAMSYAARARVERDYSWSRNLARLDPLFEEQLSASSADGSALGSRRPRTGAMA
ncbi:MAG: glycosyltransferase, partial [Rhizomicrobium sp.]